MDGKFRALFAMMFGRVDAARDGIGGADGRDGLAAHRRRMGWLAAFGLAHHLLLWSGDILLPLAMAGLIATALVRYDTLTLVKWALGLLALQWAIDLVAVLTPYALRSAALAPGAGAALVTQWQYVSDALGGSGSPSVAARDGAPSLGLWRHSGRPARGLSGAFMDILLFGLLELLAFMALGMAMLKGGFLSASGPSHNIARPGGGPIWSGLSPWRGWRPGCS